MTTTDTQVRDWEEAIKHFREVSKCWDIASSVRPLIEEQIIAYLKQDRAYLAGEGKKLLEGCYGSNWADGCAYGIKSMLAIINQ